MITIEEISVNDKKAIDEAQGARVAMAKELLNKQAKWATVKTMAEFIQEYLLGYCDNHPEFADKIADQGKSFIECLKYVKSMALDWLKMHTLYEGGDVSGDVPDEICYNWAIDYYLKAREPSKCSVKPTTENTNGCVCSGSAKRKTATKAIAPVGDKDDAKDHLSELNGNNAATTEQLSLLGA